MREFERIERIIDLVRRLWNFNSILSLGELLEKWIWADWIESRGDIFYPEDVDTERRLKEALVKAESSSTHGDLNAQQNEIIDLIRQHWPRVPDQRFGQFLSNYAFGHFLNHPPKMILRQSDETILKNLKEFR